jgi:hypothetical protein
MPIKARGLMAPDTEPTDEELALVKREILRCSVALSRTLGSRLD